MTDAVYTDSRKYKLGRDLRPGDVVYHEHKVWVVSVRGDYKYINHGYDIDWVLFDKRYVFIRSKPGKRLPINWGKEPKLRDLLGLGFDILCEQCQEPYRGGEICPECLSTSFYQVDKMGNMGVRVVGKIFYNEGD